jgi:hypothetical protein
MTMLEKDAGDVPAEESGGAGDEGRLHACVRARDFTKEVSASSGK